MLSFSVLRSFTLLSLLTPALVAATDAPNHDNSIVDWGHLSSILDTIDNNVLHHVLHNLSPKFQDGVFSKDRAAIEHVHSHNPVLATKLVYIAKRQNNGTTTGVGGVVPVPASTTRSAAAVAPTISSALSSQIYNTASSTPRPTTITVAPSPPPNAVAISTVPGGVVYSTQGGGVVTLTSSAVGVRFTKSTSTHLYYTTLPNGQVLTSTSLIVVNAPVTDTELPTGAAAATASGTPGLQNGAVKAGAVGVGSFLVGALGLFACI